MRKTKLSLYYPVAYLIVGGIGFLLLPDFFLKLFLSNSEYNAVMVRFVGLLLFVLGIMVLQIIRFEATWLYGTTLIVRSIILVGLAWFYLLSHDPLMLVLFGIVALGFVLTGVSYILDKRKNVIL